jgi:2-oxoglutarate ferredoxin oxidoreductase subunit delta
MAGDVVENALAGTGRFNHGPSPDSAPPQSIEILIDIYHIHFQKLLGGSVFMSEETIKKRKTLRTRDPRVTFYSAWCKRCGICVAFCPTKALDQDPGGYPLLARPDRCTSCRMCEMLCPDLAISVGEKAGAKAPGEDDQAAQRAGLATQAGAHRSPERLAPEPAYEEEKNAPKPNAPAPGQ